MIVTKNGIGLVIKLINYNKIILWDVNSDENGLSFKFSSDIQLNDEDLFYANKTCCKCV